MHVPFVPASRVLALQLHAGMSGFAALDGFGLTPGSWKTSRVATRSPQALARHLRALIRRFHPSVVVLGVSRRAEAVDLRLRRLACAVMRSLRVAVIVRHVREAYALLRGRIRGTHREELATTIVDGFLPELIGAASLRGVRDRRSAWHAIAVALVELVRRHPLSAAALATSRAFSIPTFRVALAKSIAGRPVNRL